MFRRESLVLYTTPDELRRIADRLDEAMKNTQFGEELPRLTVCLHSDREVQFTIDQDAWHREAKKRQK